VNGNDRSPVTELQVTACTFGSTICIPSYSGRSLRLHFLQKIFVRLTRLPLQGFEVTHPTFSNARPFVTTFARRFTALTAKCDGFHCQAAWKIPTSNGMHFSAILSSYNGVIAYICLRFVPTTAFLDLFLFVIPCSGLSWLTSAFWAHVNTASRYLIVSTDHLSLQQYRPIGFDPRAYTLGDFIFR